MPSSMNLGPGKLYCIDEAGGIDMSSTITLSIHLTYKKRYMRRKGKRYLPYYKKVDGFDPNILKKLMEVYK